MAGLAVWTGAFGEHDMKMKWILGTLGVVLLATSFAGNAWLGATLRTYRYNFNHAWFTASHERAPEFPMIGLSSSEVAQMLEQIQNVEKEGDGRLVLSVQVLGKNTAEITTGKLEGPLSGGGRIFRFNRTPTGWKLDERRIGGWVS